LEFRDGLIDPFLRPKHLDRKPQVTTARTSE
jgi:hypothetical protein